MYSVTQAPMAQPAIPPISVNIRTGLTGCSSASSISCRGMGEYTVKSVWPARRSWAIASTVASTWPNTRSEEHTSELQSQSNLVCRLLLEKKKKKEHTHDNALNNSLYLVSASYR